MTIIGWCAPLGGSVRHDLCDGWQVKENDGTPVEPCKCLCHRKKKRS